MFSIVVVDEGSGTVVIAITVTVISWSPMLVIVFSVGDGAVVVSFVIVLVDIIKTETIVLDNGAGAIVVDYEGAGDVKSTHNKFRWERGRMTTLVYWLMDGD